MSITQKRAKSARPSHKMTPHEMWKLTMKEDNVFGIDGYEVPRQYYDHYQVKWQKEIKEIQKNCKRVWPPPDWPKDSNNPDVKIPPKRPNYLDQVIKWANSYYDPNKAEEVKERLAEKGLSLETPPEPKKKDNKRNNFLENEEEKRKRKAEMPENPEWKVEALEKAKEGVLNDLKAKVPFIEKMKDKYGKKNPQWARCDKITVVADAEYVGEQIPFYNTYIKPGEDDEQDNMVSKKKKQKLFYPDKTPIWRKAPEWTYPRPKNEENPNIKAKKLLHEEKVNALMETKGITEKNLLLDVPKSFNNITDYGKVYWKYYPNIHTEDEEHYAAAKDQNPKVYPGPQHYWRTLPWKRPVKRKKDEEDEEVKEYNQDFDENGNKRYLMKRETTDRAVYKPMRKTVY